MRKVVLFIALLFMAMPAMAASTVTLTCSVSDVNVVTVSYVSDINVIRAFGLDIIFPGDVNITGVEVLDPNYRIFPGQIDIDDGNVVAYGDCYDGDDIGDANLTVELGSLYAATDPDFQSPPAKTGDLLKFWIDLDNCVGTQAFTVTENTLRGGVVMEDPYETPTVVLTGAVGSIVCGGDCYEAADKAEWIARGSPNCWCGAGRQCYGDAANDLAGNDKDGYWYVGATDLAILSSCWDVPNNDWIKEPPDGPGIATITNGICADFAHDLAGNDKDGYWYVGATDLAILAAAWDVPSNDWIKEPPDGPGFPGDCNDAP